MAFQVIDIVTGVHPRELRFPTKEAAQKWIDGYQVSQRYKDEHYRIIEN